MGGYDAKPNTFVLFGASVDYCARRGEKAESAEAIVVESYQ